MNDVSDEYRPRFSSIIVVTYGRSGSTLLNGILNAIPGYLIRGENHNFLGGLYQAYISLKISREQFGTSENDNPTNPWFGAQQLSPEKFLESAGNLVVEQLKGHDEMPDVIGFKEIRHLHHGEKLPEFLNFLYGLMPNLAVIFLQRDQDKVVKSGWWLSEDPVHLKQRLNIFDEVAKSYAANNKDRSFLIRYEEIVAKSENLEKLFAFLNAKYDQDVIESILSRSHSVSTDYILRKIEGDLK